MHKSAVVDYAMNNAQPTSWFWVNRTNLFNDALSTILAPCWSGNETVADVITKNIDALIAANQGIYVPTFREPDVSNGRVSGEIGARNE
jgi:hypothetical protein